MQHSLVGWPALEPALEAVLEFRRNWRHDLERIRRDVLRDLQEMVEDASEDTTAWLASLPAHVRATYVTTDADLVLRAWAEGWDPVVFGHDLQNAYRQCAVRHPRHCGTFLPSASGVTLWFHFAMCFRAAASVWNFNRAADAPALPPPGAAGPLRRRL